MGTISRILILLTVCIVSLIGFTARSSVENSSLSTDQPSYFKNSYPDASPRGSFLKWQWERLFYPSQEKSDVAAPQVEPNLPLIDHPEGKVVVTWIGHSTILYQCDGLNVLTDPMYSDYASPLPPFGPKRHVPPGVRLDQLPHIDVVLISHNHYDHLDLPTIKALSKQVGGPPLFLVPLKIKRWMLDNVEDLNTEQHKDKVKEFNWHQSISLTGKTANFEFTFLPVHHWSARSLWDRNETLWGSWAVIHPKFRFWFSGDLGYSKDTADIGQTFQSFDLAAIDIGSYEPRWFMANYHINPSEAVKVMQDVHAKQAFGIHWGVFKLSDEPLIQPPKDLDLALQRNHINKEIFTVFNIGESKIYKD
ncbi:MAG: MBL fold metallo-hydrolase [Betaproteobacteria bacterium]|nr:MBL fold metallo-hydrolase [Betaproteobacteria bacterium]